MPPSIYVGFDTSNYTTSAAICSSEGEILANFKLPLPVAKGERGLRQSKAVFSHIKAFPTLSGMLREQMAGLGGNRGIAAVGYSATPRHGGNSYMPCFLVGHALAENLAAFLNVPAFGVSHQAGHVMAAMYSACCLSGLSLPVLIGQPLIAFHVSGGTTDILWVEPDHGEVIRIRRIGGSADVNAGQVIGRIGVRLGHSFPCGAAMDRAALSWSGSVPRDRISVRDLDCHLSGLENKAQQMIARGEDAAYVSAYVLDFISRTVEALVLVLKARYGELPILFAGGVMASAYISQRLQSYGYFADAALSSDNAAGVALLTREEHQRGIL